LDRFRVIDLSQYVPGPYASRLLCDLGAEVIKIEPPAGDPLRRLLVPQNEGSSPIYQLLNRGKTIARIDLKVSESLSRVMELIADADVLLESYRPGVMERLGLGPEACHALNPGLVYCSLSGYGQDGPARLSAGHDLNYCAVAGMFSHRMPEEPPLPLVADHSGAMNAVNAILAALVGRGRHGQGTHLDISLYEAILSWQYVAHGCMTDSSSNPLQLLTGGAACYNFYRTRDGRSITLGALEPQFWANFCDAMAHPEWIPRQFAALPQLGLIEEVTGAVAQLTLDELVERFYGVDCCFEPVPPPEEIYHHPQTRARGVFSMDRYAYPGKFDNRIPCSLHMTRELPVEDLPGWSQ
jgi:crotonobetainyl-CoA:carnitine CoA-transferase CaiB-like acyl-CoA transferase